jgi:hypothetical protein
MFSVNKIEKGVKCWELKRTDEGKRCGRMIKEVRERLGWRFGK